jgi:predicted PurR-regulated permease PerM
MDDMLAGTQGSSMMSFFAILALVLCLLPFIGLILAVISVILSRKITGWQKLISYIAMVLSLIITIFVISGWF